MRAVQLRALVDRVIGLIVALRGDLSIFVTGVTEDSRRVRGGSLFVARRGARADGRRFVSAAVEAGAAAFLSDAEPVPEAGGLPWIQVRDVRAAAALVAAAAMDDPAEHMPVDFVTGTNGKTSTTWLCEAILAAAGLSAGVIGTVSRRYAGVLEDASMTTPDAPELQALLGRMRGAGVQRVVMELSSHAIAQDRWKPIPFRIGMFTNATRDHLDFHGSEQAYFAVKMEAFTRVLAQSPRAEAAVINVGDGLGAQIARAFGGRALTCAFEGAADLRVRHATLDIRGTRLDASYGGRDLVVESPLVGRHNAENLLVATGYGLALGLDPALICRGVAGLTRIPGRLDPIQVGGEARVLVDYAHTPDALENALGAVRAVSGDDRLVVVVGAGGDRDRGKRPLMGAAAQRLSDLVVVTSDNPRSEDPAAIIADILGGMQVGAGVVVEPDRREAIGRALAELDGRTVVVIAGKGHETYQIVGEKVHPFDDREVALEALRARGLA